MSKLVGYKYAVAIDTASEKTLVELVSENLNTASYAHNVTRSKVVSVKAEFLRLVQQIFRDTKEGELNTFSKLTSALFFGNYEIESAIWNRFVTRVAFVVGYHDLPSPEEAHEVFQLCITDYIEGNTFLSVECLLEQSLVAEARDKANEEQANAQTA